MSRDDQTLCATCKRLEFRFFAPLIIGLTANAIVSGLAWSHAEQNADRINAPDEQLVQAERYGKRAGHDDQQLDQEINLPLHSVEGDENDHRLVDHEEGITRFPDILEPFVGVIQEPHPDEEHDHRPAPAIDAVHSPGDIKTQRTG